MHHLLLSVASAAVLGAELLRRPGSRCRSGRNGALSPFAAPSTLPFHAPPFDRIKDSDFAPAFEEGMAIQRAEIERIANNPAPATFENTVVAMERSGRMLDRVSSVFFAHNSQHQ